MNETAADSRSGVALVVCAPSGAGKTTLVKRLLNEFDRFAYSVSYTTRPPREGEVDGRDYHFVQREKFRSLAEEGFFAEWAEVHGNYYGTPLAAVRENLAAGRDVLFDVDVQGAKQLRAGSLGARFVFVLPPSRQILEQRLRGRGTDSDEVVQRRLANALGELREAHWFDAVVINDDLEVAYDELRSLYISATCGMESRRPFLENILASW